MATKNLFQVHKEQKECQGKREPTDSGVGDLVTTDTEKPGVFNTVFTSVLTGKTGLPESQTVWSKEDLPSAEGE